MPDASAFHLAGGDSTAVKAVQPFRPPFTVVGTEYVRLRSSIDTWDRRIVHKITLPEAIIYYARTLALELSAMLCSQE